MDPEQYCSKDAEEYERHSLDTEEAVQLVGILQATGLWKRSKIGFNVDAPSETKQGAESPATRPVLPRECDEFMETCGEDRGNILEGFHQQPMSRTCPGVGIIAEVDSFESGKIDGIVAQLPEGATCQDSERTNNQELREGAGVTSSCNLAKEKLAEEMKSIRVKYASSQTEVRLLADRLNSSNCKVELLELELNAEKERNQRQTGRIKELENELRRNSALIGLLSDCKTKVEQLEELKQASQELIFKFQESKETAIHLRARITELESQQAIKEERIKELMDHLSKCMKTTETKDEVEKQQEEMLNHQFLSRMSEQTVHTQNECTNHQAKKFVFHSSPSSTNTSKVCMIL